MKQIVLIFMILIMAHFSFAAESSLTVPKDLTPKQATAIKHGFKVDGSTDTKTLNYPYYMLDSDGKIIRPYNNRSDGRLNLLMKNWDSVPSVNTEECIAVDDPHDCCTGEDAGTCDDTFLNADCTDRGVPMKCCTGSGEGICEGWDGVKSYLIPLGVYLKGELEKWENVTFE